MKKSSLLTLLFLLLAQLGLAQYTLKTGGPPPAELAPSLAATLQQQGSQIIDSQGKLYAEFWFRNSSVDGPETGEPEVSWTTVAHGTLIGAVRFPAAAQDRRGDKIQPGVYTLRFSFYPIDGAHQGLEPSRDFLVLSPAAIDKDPNARPTFKQLMAMSRKASGVPHPLVLAMWKADPGDWKAGLSQLQNDWVLNVKIGSTPISVIVQGVNPKA